MLTIQPPFSPAYFTLTPQSVGYNHPNKSFFLSWEDALWHLLTVFGIKPDATIMVPEFFCGNVIEHMMEHRLKIVYYPVDRHLQTPRNSFISQLQLVKPKLLVIFHPVGIHNQLLVKSDQWRKFLPSDCLLIEDCVHQLVSLRPIKFLTKRHVLIDSLRKVVPIQGSFVYSAVSLPPISQSQKLGTLPYNWSVLFWWLLMQICLLLATHAPTVAINRWLNLLAEKAMLRGYHRIGQHQRGAPGSWLMKALTNHIALDKNAKTKNHQAKIYIKAVQVLTKTNQFWLPTLQPTDYPMLRGFPLIINTSIAAQFLTFLRNQGIIIRFELNDSPWSQNQKIVYLPMGIHVSQKDLNRIARVLQDYASSL